MPGNWPFHLCSSCFQFLSFSPVCSKPGYIILWCNFFWHLELLCNSDLCSIILIVLQCSYSAFDPSFLTLAIWHFWVWKKLHGCAVLPELNRYCSLLATITACVLQNARQLLLFYSNVTWRSSYLPSLSFFKLTKLISAGTFLRFD